MALPARMRISGVIKARQEAGGNCRTIILEKRRSDRKAASIREAAFLCYFYLIPPFAGDIPNSPMAHADSGNDRTQGKTAGMPNCCQRGLFVLGMRKI